MRRLPLITTRLGEFLLANSFKRASSRWRPKKGVASDVILVHLRFKYLRCTIIAFVDLVHHSTPQLSKEDAGLLPSAAPTSFAATLY